MTKRSSSFNLAAAVEYLRHGYQSMSLTPAEAHVEAMRVIDEAGEDRSKQILAVTALIVEALGVERVLDQIDAPRRGA
jgi:hypothetical protein